MKFTSACIPVGRKVNHSRLPLAVLSKGHQLNLKKVFGFARNVYHFPLGRAADVNIRFRFSLAFLSAKCLWILEKTYFKTLISRQLICILC